MRSKKQNIILFLFFALGTPNLYAAHLLQVYHDALQNDPIYQQALAQQFSTAEGVPISLANLLPNAGIKVTPSLSRTLASGSAINFATLPDGSSVAGSSAARGYNVTLTMTQTVFDFSKWSNLTGAKETAKQARATFNAATQELMIRVAKAYLAILEDEDNLRSALSTQKAFSKQLDQIREEYKVGLKTITDVYTAQASYENSAADYITAENTLANDKENLRAITANLYPSLNKLSEQFPLVSPQPADIEQWVTTTQQQNWSIKSAEYAKVAAMANLKQQRAGHLPTLNLEGDYTIDYTRTMGNAAAPTTGSSRLRTAAVNMTLGIPLYQGGAVVAQTDKAKYDYQIVSQKLEKQMRDATNLARQSYLGVIAGISKIKADREGIKSSQSSLEGMEAGYSVGTETLVNVLNQRQKVFQAQKQYAHDRYAYVNNLLTLKQAAGTLSEEDLAAVNRWLLI